MWMTGLSFLYRLLLAAKDLAYQAGLRRAQRFDVPIVVVGNITVGGTGKTPLVIHLVEILRTAGYYPGVVSRGYGSSAGAGPRPVKTDSPPAAVGDEPLLIHRRSGVPVMVGSDRIAGIHRLLAHVDRVTGVDAVIVIAGMEGALASVVGGLTACPVVAVPTSVGYGSALDGVTALLAMHASCASGVTVVGIDNGFGAASAVARMLRR